MTGLVGVVLLKLPLRIYLKLRKTYLQEYKGLKFNARWMGYIWDMYIKMDQLRNKEGQESDILLNLLV